jgi:hypothetical protein
VAIGHMERAAGGVQDVRRPRHCAAFAAASRCGAAGMTITTVTGHHLAGVD